MCIARRKGRSGLSVASGGLLDVADILSEVSSLGVEVEPLWSRRLPGGLFYALTSAALQYSCVRPGA